MSLRSPQEIRRGKRKSKIDLGEPSDMAAIVKEIATGSFFKSEHEAYQDKLIRERGYGDPHVDPGLIICPSCGTKHLMFVWKCVVCNYVFYRR